MENSDSNHDAVNATQGINISPRNSPDELIKVDNNRANNQLVPSQSLVRMEQESQFGVHVNEPTNNERNITEELYEGNENGNSDRGQERGTNGSARTGNNEAVGAEYGKYAPPIDKITSWCGYFQHRKQYENVGCLH